jgi:hypothetical protein
MSDLWAARERRSEDILFSEPMDWFLACGSFLWGSGYVYGLDLLTRIDGTDEEWYLYDGLGSTTGLADDTGAVTGSYEYDVFGAERAHSGDATEWSYTGEQHDSTGWEYLRARCSTDVVSADQPTVLPRRHVTAGLYDGCARPSNSPMSDVHRGSLARRVRGGCRI